MLTDDVVIINGGCGLVAQSAVQLCAMRGVKAIAVVRERDIEDHIEIVERLKKDGAYIVVTEAELQRQRFKELISDLPAPKLALSSTGGPVATNLARLLGEGGTFVNFGNSTGQPLMLPASLLIFKNITIRSFNFERWLSVTPLGERQQLLDRLASLVAQQKLKVWVEAFEMWDFRTAFSEMALPKDRKLVFSLQDNMHQ